LRAPRRAAPAAEPGWAAGAGLAPGRGSFLRAAVGGHLGDVEGVQCRLGAVIGTGAEEALDDPERVGEVGAFDADRDPPLPAPGRRASTVGTWNTTEIDACARPYRLEMRVTRS
jgi:hypothetical protein